MAEVARAELPGGQQARPAGSQAAAQGTGVFLPRTLLTATAAAESGGGSTPAGPPLSAPLPVPRPPWSTCRTWSSPMAGGAGGASPIGGAVLRVHSRSMPSSGAGTTGAAAATPPLPDCSWPPRPPLLAGSPPSRCPPGSGGGAAAAVVTAAALATATEDVVAAIDAELAQLLHLRDALTARKLCGALPRAPAAPPLESLPAGPPLLPAMASDASWASLPAIGSSDLGMLPACGSASWGALPAPVSVDRSLHGAQLLFGGDSSWDGGDELLCGLQPALTHGLGGLQLACAPYAQAVPTPPWAEGKAAALPGNASLQRAAAAQLAQLALGTEPLTWLDQNVALLLLPVDDHSV